MNRPMTIEETSEQIVEGYEFKSFDSDGVNNNSNVETYAFRNFKEGVDVPQRITSKQIKIEREKASGSSFIISPIVFKHRGLLQQEEEELEQRIEKEVDERVQMIHDEAYAEGFEQGQLAGREEILQKTLAEAEEKIMHLEGMLMDILSVREQIVEKQKKELLGLVKNLTKWIIIKELDADKNYHSRLLEKLLLELQTKSNLLVRVNQKYFDAMPEVLAVVEKRLGVLTNVRTEIDYDIDGKGIILESENGMINGTLSQQFENLDKLYAALGVETDDRGV